MLFDRQKEHAENAPPTVWAPCFSWNGNQLKARVNVSLVQKGYEISNCGHWVAEEEPELISEYIIKFFNKK